MSEINVARLVKLGSPLELGTIQKPTPGPTDVLVKVESCSLVPNAKNLIENDSRLAIPDLPCVFGLDVSGTIESVGENVMNLKVGDRVYVDPFLNCRSCHFCRKGEKERCPNWALRGYFSDNDAPQSRKVLAQYPIGGLSQYVLSPDSNILVLPSNVDFNLAARFGYTCTSFAALKRGGAGPGKTVLINGVTGTLGYAATACALGLGCTKILGIGRNPERLEEVSNLAPGTRISTASSEEEKDIPGWVKRQTGGLGPDVMIDCLGVGGDPKSTMELIHTLKLGGTCMLTAGGANGDLVQDYQEAMVGQTPIVGSTWFTGAHLDELAALVEAGIIDLSFIEHKEFPLSKVNEAFDVVGDRPGGATHIVVKPQQK